MNNKEDSARHLLEYLKEMQEYDHGQGIDVIPCPCCGTRFLFSTRALSRLADVYVCEQCSIKESKDSPKPFTEWYFPQKFMNNGGRKHDPKPE